MDFKIADAARELLGFVASFLTTGAVAFRYVVLRGDVVSEGDIAGRAAKRAAIYGFIGAVITLLMFLMLDLRPAAAEQHLSMPAALAASGPTLVTAICVALTAVGLALALAQMPIGWALAAGGVVVGPLTGLLSGKWARVVNPIHRLAGGLWIGTLFILLAAGFVTVLRSSVSAERRGVLAANMVHRFSPFALGSFAVLALTGLITAWRHLKRIDALWTTQYGWTLIAKLIVVLVVLSLGAWNWRRQRPLLGSESAATVLQRSATMEVIAATIVLMITAVLVSLPSPR